MDDERNPNPEFTYSSICEPESAPHAHASGMFSDSQQFTVTGGTFTNITKNYAAAPSVPCDLRTITMGDIDLRNEIRVSSSRVGKQARVRRMYSARVEGRKGGLTAAIY